MASPSQFGLDLGKWMVVCCSERGELSGDSSIRSVVECEIYSTESVLVEMSVYWSDDIPSLFVMCVQRFKLSRKVSALLLTRAPRAPRTPQPGHAALLTKAAWFALSETCHAFLCCMEDAPKPRRSR